MKHPDLIAGRLGNRMFQIAFMVDFAMKNKTDIWFQDEKWFKDVAPSIRYMFSDGISQVPIDKVSIHVRRGDYVIPPHNDFFANLGESDYYDKAISYFPNEQFMIFSDDIEFCKTLFKGDRFEFSEGKSEIDDMNLMASCKHNIIANSSFSWWAAWLNPNPKKIVIAPLAWSVKQAAVVPETWIRL